MEKSQHLYHNKIVDFSKIQEMFVFLQALFFIPAI